MAQKPKEMSSKIPQGTGRIVQAPRTTKREGRVASNEALRGNRGWPLTLYVSLHTHVAEPSSTTR